MRIQHVVTRFFLICQLALWAIAANAQSPTTVAGPLPGQGAVSESGAAIYRIPIQVPPGVAGMQPKLELVYNSQGANGPLGVGWNLSGLSAISRCPRTMASDGVRGGANLDANDRFCLDGQRLILVSGTYGAANSEYRTERETFSKVVASGTAGTGPQSFVVKTKAGLTMEYGASADARIEAQGKTEVRLWALNKISDVMGNYLSVSYLEDNANGDFRPDRIDYGGNQAAGRAHFASVRFVYQDRTDSPPLYQSGSMIKVLKRLANVQTYTLVGPTDTLVHDYRLEFEFSPVTQRTRLTKVTQCTAGNVCLQPITMGWVGTSAPSSIFAFSNTQLPGASTGTNSYLDTGNQSVITGDFNGDGKSDLLHLHPSADPQYSWVALANGDGTFTFARKLPGAAVATNSFLDTTSKNIVTGDFNGDGKTDLLHLHPSSDPQYSWVALSNGDGTFTFTRTLPGASTATNSFLGNSGGCWGCPPPTSEEVLTGDFNGDGLTDLLHLQPSADPQYSWVALSNGNGTFTFTRSLPGASTTTKSYLDGTYKDIVTGDFNGDGKTDLLHLHPSADPQYSWVALSNGDGSFTFSNTSLPGASVATNSYLDANWNIVTGDFNGDGKTDLLHLHPNADPQYSWVALSKGNGTFIFAKTLPGASVATYSYLDTSNQGVVTGDFNGDGLTDLLHLHPNADPQYSWIALSKGDGNFTFSRSLPGAAVATSSYLDANQNIVTGDFNGDGKTDLLHLHPNAASQYSWVALQQTAGSLPDNLLNVYASHGTATFNYSNLTNSQIYTKGSINSTYPRTDVQVPVYYVVTSFELSNGLGGTNATSYTYGELKAELGTGRGMLGFRWVKSSEVRTGVERYTEYRQGAPYTGMPSKSETRLANSGNAGVLKRTTFSLACQNPLTAAACTLAAGNGYFPYVAQSVEESWDVSGTALPVITQNYVYGQNPQYGDPTQITVGNSVGGTKTAVNTYTNDAANWILGRLTRSQVTSDSAATPPGSTSQSLPPFNFMRTIAADTPNYNLKADAAANGWDQQSPLNASITVNSGVFVGSAAANLPAFDTGAGLPAGSALTLVNNGFIIGAGGTGGMGGGTASLNGVNGGNGGPALSAGYPVSVTNSGTIGGGGGGGGGGGAFTASIDQTSEIGAAGGGGGGRGASGGGGGSAGTWSGTVTPPTINATNGTAGSRTVAGTGGNGADTTFVIGPPQATNGSGGAGGGFGASGSNGVNAYIFMPGYSSAGVGGVGGAAGPAVIGNSNITWISTGTRLGALQ